MLAPAVTGSISIFCFASLLGTPIGITSSAIELKVFVITEQLESISQKLRKRKES